MNAVFAVFLETSERFEDNQARELICNGGGAIDAFKLRACYLCLRAFVSKISVVMFA